MANDYVKWQVRIDQFREFVNGYSNILILLSENIDNPNYWNCICSAMDWMNIAVEQLTKSVIDKTDWHKYSIQVYNHISLIDIVWESIKQLHKIYIDSNTVPFADENSIFLDERLGLDDNRYFMHIRAAFGAHPVNLSEGRKNDGTHTTRYAGWPTTGIYHEYDYAVMLYSGRNDLDDVVFGFRMDQLTNYFESRYTYLEEIEKAIIRIVNDYISKAKACKIAKYDIMIDQLNVLKLENRKRLYNDYYDEIIDMAISFYETEFTNPMNANMVDEFETIMRNGVEELYEKISKMDVVELDIDLYLHPEYTRLKHFGYSYSKLCEYVLGYSNKNSFLVDDIIEPLKMIVSFDGVSLDELFWLAVIALNKMNEMI